MPAQDRLGLHNIRYRFERTIAETISDFSQCPPFAVSQAQATLDLIPKNPILDHKIFVPQEKLLVHGS